MKSPETTPKPPPTPHLDAVAEAPHDVHELQLALHAVGEAEVVELQVPVHEAVAVHLAGRGEDLLQDLHGAELAPLLPLAVEDVVL